MILYILSFLRIEMAVYILFGKPREGKNLVAAEKIIHWLDDMKLNVYTNFPLLTPKGNSPRIWEDKLIYANVQDSQIVIDESYQDWGSQDATAQKDADRMTFIHTTGHQNNDIWFIVQSPVRILKAIRDIATEVHIVKKYCVPWPLPWFKDREGSNRPLFMRVLTYSQWEDMMDPSPDKADGITYYLFKKWVAQSYDTHYFRNNQPPHVGETWLERKQRLDSLHDPYDIEGLLEKVNTD